MTNINITGLIVTGSTKYDNYLIERIIENEGFSAEFDSEFNNFTFEEIPENYDSLEMELCKIFNRNNINARFESI